MSGHTLQAFVFVMNLSLNYHMQLCFPPVPFGKHFCQVLSAKVCLPLEENLCKFLQIYMEQDGG